MQWYNGRFRTSHLCGQSVSHYLNMPWLSLVVLGAELVWIWWVWMFQDSCWPSDCVQSAKMCYYSVKFSRFSHTVLTRKWLFISRKLLKQKNSQLLQAAAPNAHKRRWPTHGGNQLGPTNWSELQKNRSGTCQVWTQTTRWHWLTNNRSSHFDCVKTW